MCVSRLRRQRRADTACGQTVESLTQALPSTSQVITGNTEECGGHQIYLHTCISLSPRPRSLLVGLSVLHFEGDRYRLVFLHPCHSCHLQPKAHFTASPIWGQQLQTPSVAAAISRMTNRRGPLRQFLTPYEVYAPQKDCFSKMANMSDLHPVSIQSDFREKA